jgi:GNAT superfamily N-acetyltransferase
LSDLKEVPWHTHHDNDALPKRSISSDVRTALTEALWYRRLTKRYIVRGSTKPFAYEHAQWHGRATVDQRWLGHRDLTNTGMTATDRMYADRAARGLESVYERMSAALPEAWVQRAPGAFLAVTMIPLPTLNGVTVTSAECRPEIVASLLDQVAATGVPHSLRLRSGTDPSLPGLASARGMTPGGSIPLMVMDDIAAVEPERDKLEIDLLEADNAARHATVAAAGFEAPESIFRGLITPEVLRLPGTRCYMGKVAGEAVSTGFGFSLDDSVGIFDIATVPAHRAHGYGAAITSRILHDAANHGMSWAWLQSSPSGLGVYKRLGFRTVESWHIWTSNT